MGAEPQDAGWAAGAALQALEALRALEAGPCSGAEHPAVAAARAGAAGFARLAVEAPGLTGAAELQRQAEGELAELHGAAWERIHAGPQVAGGASAGGGSLGPWREAFGICCAMRCALLAAEAGPAAEALRVADLGIVVAGSEALAAPALQEAAGRLSADLARASAVRRAEAAARGSCAPPAEEEGAAPAAKRARSSGGAVGPPPPGRLAGRRSEAPAVRGPPREVGLGRRLGLEDFLLNHLSARVPVVLRGGCAGWPAVGRWDRRDFWCDGAIGQRFVPVEMDYWLEEGFQMMTVRDFVEHCSSVEMLDAPPPGLSGGGYLAQHALFDQVPSLLADVLTPDFALCGPEGSLLRQVFFGPRGTTTPLHTDPYENIFCQVVGSKYVRLYSPRETPRLYPRREGGPLQNNSTVEPADLLLGEASGAYARDGPFGALRDAQYVDAVLEPGDVLYLPRGWWHFVSSLSTSISVAFHFN